MDYICELYMSYQNTVDSSPAISNLVFVLQIARQKVPSTRRRLCSLFKGNMHIFNMKL